ncbi:DUF5987 family protein [Actinomadura sp. NEAU-AAG7]|uniref:DUF5987 family protein n=1 Tax=Actinomadura sp. NEAU-AAG7 TaxID=2839640 RepID=UPI001BE3EE92|nr:DUF5987 family protein [Actinomadura sp. NEAU-AAG7]MBT2212856.1 regulator [Actinomadura sp. NEAU-AAG7]
MTDDAAPDGDDTTTLTLEAFADTIVPGEKRGPDDVAIAGAAPGPGAVQAGAMELLGMFAPGISEALDGYAQGVNEHALGYARERGLDLDAALPPFVALTYADRAALVRTLTTPGHPEKDFWVLLALFCNMAYDTAAHMHTTDALATGHPGLTAMGFMPPDADGLWRFGAFSYGRELASIHPDTTSTGSPS